MKENVSSHPRNLYSVRRFSEQYPEFSQGSLRNLIFLAKSRKTSRGDIHGNGLDRAIVRLGRRLLIDEARFFQWIEEQQA